MKPLLFIAFFLGLMLISQVDAQSVRKSQKGTISQEIANTEISIEYYRPVARERTLFGVDGIVKFDTIWMPGANNATIIEVSDDITINGSQLKAGKYSIWSIPNNEEWTIIFSNKWDAWHSQYPEGEDELRIKATTEEGTHMEVLAYYFPEVTEDSATLRLHWGKTIIPLKIEI